MRKIIFIITGLIPVIVYGQQFPSLEGFNLNPFNLSPAYSGIRGSNTLFIDYRSDWSGIDGGPATFELSYNQKVAEKKQPGGDFNYDQSDLIDHPVGLGGRFIYDQADIFKQILLLGTYTYEVRIARGHTLNFGLSAGFYRNSLDLGQYYNNPGYVQDLALINGQLTSKLKFATDVSALYRYEQLEAGVLFSNVIFGTTRYQPAATSYRPMKNYLVHTSYLFRLDDKWSFRPFIIARGGENIPVQLEIAPAFNWNNRIWISGIYRTGGIFGSEVGCEVARGIFFNYSYSLSTNIALSVFGNHQVSLGIKIPELSKKQKVLKGN